MRFVKQVRFALLALPGLMFDGMLGPNYQVGLGNLKQILETPAGD